MRLLNGLSRNRFRRGAMTLGATFLAASLACTSGSPAPAGGVIAPRTVRRVEPAYPPALRQQRVEGVVEIEAVIPKEGGYLHEVRVVRSDDPRLTPLVLSAVAQWIWEPGLSNGEPVDVPFRIRFEFPPG